MNIFVDFVALILRILYFSIFLRAIISWFPIDQNNSLVRSLDTITEPIIEHLFYNVNYFESVFKNLLFLKYLLGRIIR